MLKLLQEVGHPLGLRHEVGGPHQLIDHTLIGWGWWLWDWDWFRAPAPERLVRRFAGRVSGGDIIVMHDGHHEDPRADRRYAVDATLRLVPLLQDQGFAFGTIC